MGKRIHLLRMLSRPPLTGRAPFDSLREGSLAVPSRSPPTPALAAEVRIIPKELTSGAKAPPYFDLFRHGLSRALPDRAQLRDPISFWGYPMSRAFRDVGAKKQFLKKLPGVSCTPFWEHRGRNVDNIGRASPS